MNFIVLAVLLSGGDGDKSTVKRAASADCCDILTFNLYLLIKNSIMEGVSPLPADIPCAEDKENAPSSAAQTRLGVKSINRDARISALDHNSPFGARPKRSTLVFAPSTGEVEADNERMKTVLASCTDDEGDHGTNQGLTPGYNDTVFETPIFNAQPHSMGPLSTGEHGHTDSKNFASPGLSLREVDNDITPLQSRVNFGNIETSVLPPSENASTAFSSAADEEVSTPRLDRHVVRLPFEADEESMPKTPFSGSTSQRVS